MKGLCRFHLSCLVAFAVAMGLIGSLYFSVGSLEPVCNIRSSAADTEMRLEASHALTRMSRTLAPTSKRPPAIRSAHLAEFSYIHWPEPCSEMEPQPLLLGAVISTPSNFTRRKHLRRLYMSQREYLGFRLRWVFILGSVPNLKLQLGIDKEIKNYADIVQFSFQDSYENLTLKTLAAIDWTAAACPGAKFFFKTDTDCMVNPFRIVNYLAPLTLAESHKLYAGSVPRWLEPNRHSGVKKWRVSYQNYPLVKYPRYANGPGYLLSRAALFMLLEASDATFPMRLEDVYMGLCAMRAGLAPKHHPWYFVMHLYSYSNWCQYHRGLVMHQAIGSEMTSMWSQMLEHKDAARSAVECRLSRQRSANRTLVRAPK